MSLALSLPQLGLSTTAGGLTTLSPCVLQARPTPGQRGWILARIEGVRRGFAVLLGGMGIAILTEADKWVEARVLGWLPDVWLNLTIGI